MDMETSKLTAEGIIGEAVRIGAKMSGSEFPIELVYLRHGKSGPCHWLIGLQSHNNLP